MLVTTLIVCGYILSIILLCIVDAWFDLDISEIPPAYILAPISLLLIAIVGFGIHLTSTIKAARVKYDAKQLQKRIRIEIAQKQLALVEAELDKELDQYNNQKIKA